ncbi:hypothetical protein EC412_05020 [Salmonella enterica subsp. enterica serovar Redlands]|nr:hypothetical protein [Salmonella enterica subsp. enterica serovar Redlands]
MAESNCKTVRDKIISNGFTKKELLALRNNYKKIKNTFHPKLTKDLVFIKVIQKTSRDSLSPLQIFFPVALFFLIPPIVSGEMNMFFMSILFSMFGCWDICATAKKIM